jgi:hypothetical protein
MCERNSSESLFTDGKVEISLFKLKTFSSEIPFMTVTHKFYIVRHPFTETSRVWEKSIDRMAKAC